MRICDYVCKIDGEMEIKGVIMLESHSGSLYRASCVFRFLRLLLFPDSVTPFPCRMCSGYGSFYLNESSAVAVFFYRTAIVCQNLSGRSYIDFVVNLFVSICRRKHIIKIKV